MMHPTQRIRAYFNKRGIPMAREMDAYIFLVSEVGEVGDALMRMQPGWVRNNPDKVVSLRDELADVYMMLSRMNEPCYLLIHPKALHP